MYTFIETQNGKGKNNTIFIVQPKQPNKKNRNKVRVDQKKKTYRYQKQITDSLDDFSAFFWLFVAMNG